MIETPYGYADPAEVAWIEREKRAALRQIQACSAHLRRSCSCWKVPRERLEREILLRKEISPEGYISREALELCFWLERAPLAIRRRG